MLNEIKIPSMGATMEEGKIVAWHAKEGDRIKPGEILLEIETDKSVFEVECPFDGIVRKILAPEGETLPVQSVIALVGDAGDAIPAAYLTNRPAAPRGTPSPAASAQVSPLIEQPGRSHERPLQQNGVAAVRENRSVSDMPMRPADASPSRGQKISPRARKLAEQLGVDFSAIQGTGPDGRIESGDVEKAAHAQPVAGGSAQAGDAIIPFDSMRLAINRTVVKSKQEIPHFYIGATIDASRLTAYRQQHSTPERKLSVNAIFMKAIAHGLAAEPSLNMAITDTGYKRHSSVNVGLAIETPKGVVIAVVENVDKHDVMELSAQIGKLVEIVRAGRVGALKPSAACMTISNIGMYRADWFIPIIRPGDAAILGIGSLAERPIVLNGNVTARLTMPATLCVDHRIADGAAAARFLKAFAEYLEGL